MIKGLIKFVFVSFVLAAIAGIAVVKAIPKEELQKKISFYIEQETGQKLAFSGFDISFSPDLSLGLENVVLGDDRPVARLKMLEVKLAIAPLLQKRIEIKKLILDTPDIYLETKAGGQKNWGVPAQQKQPETNAGFKTILGDVEIRRGKIDYVDLKKGTRLSFSGLDLTASPSGKFSARGTADIDSRAVSFIFTADQWQQILAGDKETPITLDISSPAVPFKKISVTAAAKITPASAALSKATLLLDNVSLRGDILVSYAGAKPNLSLKLATDIIDLDQLQPSGAPDSREKTGKKENWPEKPWDFSALQQFNMDASLQAKGVLYQGLVLGESRINAGLREGDLSLKWEETPLFGGKINFKLALRNTGNIPAWALSANIADAAAKPLFTALAGVQKVNGTLTASVDLTSSGKSEKDVIDHLTGGGVVILRDGSIEGIDLARAAQIARNLTQAQQDVEGGKTEFVEMKGSFTALQGVLENKDFIVTGPLVSATGTGSIALPQKQVSYKVNPVLAIAGADPKAPKLSVPILVYGPFDHIRVRPDYESIANQLIRNPGDIKNTAKSLESGLKNLKKDLKQNPGAVLENILGKGGLLDQLAPAPKTTP